MATKLSGLKPLKYSDKTRAFQFNKFFKYFRDNDIQSDEIFEFLLGFQIVNGREVPNYLNINRTDEYGHTALHWAGEVGDVELAKALIKGRACLVSPTKQGLTPLHAAAANREIMDLMLDDKRKRVKDANIWVNTCCHVGNLESVRSQMEQDPSLINRADIWGMHPVHWAAAGGHKPVLELLLSLGASLHVQDSAGWTPLFWSCCYRDNKDVLEYLINHGAKIDHMSKFNDLPIHIAAEMGNNDAIELLLKHGATLDTHNNDGMFPINHAASRGHNETIKLLHKHGANIFQTSKGGISCLHQAVINNHLHTFKLLLEMGLKIDARTDNGDTVLHASSLYGHEDLLREIIRLEPSLVNCKSKNNETPLFNACLNENQNIVKILLDHSANIFIKDTEGITALDLVVAVDNKEILDCFISACVKDPITFLAESDIGTQGTYTTLIAELGIENVIDKYFDKTDKSGKKLFYQTHLTLATKMKNEDLINSFCNSLLSKDSQWSHRDAFDILHYINPNTSTFSKTCLNYANENNDQKAGYKLLKVEDYAHNKSAYQVFSCIQQNLNMEALVPWLKKIYVDNIRKGLIPVTDYNDDMIKRKNRQALIAIIVEIGLISVLPFLIDFTSDLELLGDYKHISHIADNETNVWECGLDTNISYISLHQIPFEETKENFAFAAKVTMAMVAMNVIVYMFGAKIASPEWLDVWKKGWDENNLQYEFVRSQNMDWYGKKLRDYPAFKQKYFWIKIFYKVMLGISYILWPFLILMPNKYAYQISENPNERREGDAKSSTAWRFVKIAESGVENILQLVLQIWLIMPALVLVSQWSWSTVASHTWQGILNILSFGIYDTCLLDKTLGKLVFTAITCSVGLSFFKVDRPGIGALYKIKAAPVIFLHLLIQIIARLYALKYLILLEINQYAKYLTALLVHIAILIPIKVITETQKLPRSLGLMTLLQRLALLLISCISSSIIMIDWHWNSSHLQAPKFMFFSRILFQVLLLVENLAMVLLPAVLPQNYNKQDSTIMGEPGKDVLIIIGMWIVSVSFKALYYKKLHKWSKVMGPRRLKDSRGCSFKTRLCCYEETQKITFKFDQGFEMEDYEGIRYIPPTEEKVETKTNSFMKIVQLMTSLK